MREYPWNNKKENAAKASAHTTEMYKCYPHRIMLSSEHSVIFDGESVCLDRELKNQYKTEVVFLGMDTVSALAYLCNSESINILPSFTGLSCIGGRISNIGILNFASYKHPGGMFLEGSMAQEEALCHESFLYNVLKNHPEYYEHNKKYLNKALYTNRAIFTPDIIFRDQYECGVLTCAAPNFTTGHRFKNVSEAENYDVMCQRADFMLECFAACKCRYIILGAWGCGVFGQKPDEVAKIFKELIEGKFKGVFDKIIIAVPEDKRNYPAFKKVFAET